MNEMIWQDAHKDPSLEYPFHCFAELPSLQDIASYRVCQAMWHSYMSSPNTCLWKIVASDEDPVEALLDGLQIANPIKKILELDEQTISWQLYRYSSYLEQNHPKIEADQRTLEMEMDISWCVWLPNGLLDYRASTIEMLKSGRLNETQKFIVMSKLCLEDEMKTICLRSLPDCIKYVDFNGNPLIFYWVCYLKDELWRVPLYENSTLEKTMAVSCFEKEEKLALEYFWFRMTNDDRISTAKIIVHEDPWEEEEDCWNFLERLLCSISFSSTKSFAKLSASYLRQSLYKSLSTQHQLRIWHRFKDEIAACDFADMITEAFSNLIASEDRLRILIDMWDTANDHQKQYVVQHKDTFVILEIIFLEYDDPSPCKAAFDLVYEILSRKPKLERLKLFKEYANQLATRIEPIESFQKMLNLCLPEANLQSEFKNTLSRSPPLQEMCVSFLQQNKYADLNAKLEWIFNEHSPNAVYEYKKLILKLMTYKYASKVASFFVNIDRWNKLSEFIDELYTQEGSFEIKRSFIEQAIAFRRSEYFFHDYFDITKQIIEKVLPIEDLKRFKRKHLDYLVEQFRYCTYWKDEHAGDEVFLSRFVKWCCDYDKQSICEFKKSVPPDAILNSIVLEENDTAERFHKGHMSKQNLKAWLRRMDRYLRWFVRSAKRARECKLRAIEDCTIDVSIFKVVNDENETKKVFRKIVLKWFCGSDKEKMKRFTEERS